MHINVQYTRKISTKILRSRVPYRSVRMISRVHVQDQERKVPDHIMELQMGPDTRSALQSGVSSCEGLVNCEYKKESYFRKQWSCTNRRVLYDQSFRFQRWARFSFFIILVTEN